MAKDAMCEQQCIQVKPDSSGLSCARCWVSRMIENMCFEEDEACGLFIAVGEAVSNAYLHGTPDPELCMIDLSWSLTADALTITVNDSGRCEHRHTTQLPDRGMLARGAELMRSGVDEVFFTDKYTSPVVLIKHLAPSDRGTAA